MAARRLSEAVQQAHRDEHWIRSAQGQLVGLTSSGREALRAVEAAQAEYRALAAAEGDE